MVIADLDLTKLTMTLTILGKAVPIVLLTAGKNAKIQMGAPHLPFKYQTLVTYTVVVPIHVETAIQLTLAMLCKVITR